MSFFQNPFNKEYQGYWVLGDRAHSLTFKCPLNTGRADEFVRSYGTPPYDLDGTDAEGNNLNSLTISFAADPDLNNYVDLVVNVASAASTLTSVTNTDILNSLNANTNFTSYFQVFNPYQTDRIEIKSKKDATKFKFYIKNTGAETILNFNKFAGVAQLPTYFKRHTIENRYDYKDSVAHLVLLDGTDGVDANVINNAVDPKGNSLNFDATNMLEDWELLEGRSGLFQFTIAVDATTSLVYPAGAKEGYLAKMIIDDGTNVFELPYTLDSSDLVNPS